MKFYAIKRGKDGISKIVTSWDECERLVKGVSCAVYKSFKWKDQADEWMKQGMPKWAKPEKKEIEQITATFIPATNKKNKYGYYKPRYYRENGCLMASYGRTIGCDCDPDKLYQGQEPPWD